ncbi:MAG: hypothetical protein R6U50_12405 [Desulfobacterales bacterium]
MEKRNISSIIRENKTLFIIIALGFFLLELEIFALAASKSGRATRIQIRDSEQMLLHEVKGSRLTDSDKRYIETFFGPLENLNVRMTSTEQPFPFRAWFAAAAGVPVAVMLLLVLFVKTYTSLFYPELDGSKTLSEEAGPPKGKLETLSARVSRYHIFTVGFLIFLAAFAYWVIPNFLAFFGKLSIDTVIRYKWFFLSAFALTFGLGVWIIYLRYSLAKKALHLQAETEKYRIELEYRQPGPAIHRIGYDCGCSAGADVGSDRKKIHYIGE